ncbi:ABC transporter ATP-binding protein [Fervidobacterium nodosum]|uniref:ABC transporter related n=1 Tax=Fervidobacterium nodosum (strain ATCC 35602 / DSM 5306 / Rt17-B1) TaxID=381764 RepID=A7HMB9_FERNB|nr:ABC transporter ATP-binding protein [Fervidobacterium nodosum]ABS61052.1 ABC transporter related [Fervidobacterium nodosum Rt17-B1]PHJ13910.1 ABC transporter [Fervidobacterium sp. SC_NGM5_G05]HOJ93813.1 ABC transporter ATP-binding protein [Fervidobacterium nodosum]
MLKLINLSKEFLDENGQKKIALKNINAEFDYGNVVAVIGENGSGKSTLLNIIATFLKPSNGLVLLNEKNIFEDIKKYREMVSYVSEKGTFITELSVEDNLIYFSKIFKSNANIKDILERVGITHILKNKPSSLSKGQRQRLSLAISMLKNPKIVLLDEPAEGLDVETKEVVKSLVSEYKNTGKLVFYVTHDEDEIEDVCDKILVLKSGESLFCGSVEDFWREYEKFYRVTYIFGGEKRTKIMNLQELNKISGQLNIVHVRNLGLREIINLDEKNN